MWVPGTEPGSLEKQPMLLISKAISLALWFGFYIKDSMGELGSPYLYLLLRSVCFLPGAVSSIVCLQESHKWDNWDS